MPGTRYDNDVAAVTPSRPNTFLVGAPKCGTTTLHAVLSDHADVFMAEKEPHYFAPDLATRDPQLSEAEYLGLFDGAGDAPTVAEASVGYLYSELAAEAIAAFSPEARIVVAVREPLATMRSLHGHCLFYGIEEIASFTEAVAASGDRREGRRVPPRSAHPWMLDYLGVASFAPSIERYRSAVPAPDRIHIVVLEELAQDRDREMRELFAFLGIEDRAPVGGEDLNFARASRSPRFSGMLIAPPPAVRKVARSAMPKAMRRSVADGLLRLNTRRGTDQPEAEPVPRWLRDHVEAQRAAVIELLGRTPAGW